MPKAANTVERKVYFSPEEFERVCEKAYLADMRVGTYIRKAALGGVVKKYDMESVNELTTAINHFGTLLNQIVKVINETHSVYQSDMEQIQAIWKRYLVTINNLIYEELKSEELK